MLDASVANCIENIAEFYTLAALSGLILLVWSETASFLLCIVDYEENGFFSLFLGLHLPFYSLQLHPFLFLFIIMFPRALL